MYQLLMIQIDQVLDSRARARTQSACENGHKKCCHDVLLETLGFVPTQSPSGELFFIIATEIV